MPTFNELPMPPTSKADTRWTGHLKSGDINLDLSDYKYIVIVTQSYWTSDSQQADNKPRGCGICPVPGESFFGANDQGGQTTYNTTKRVTTTTSKVTIGTTRNAKYNQNNAVIAILGIKEDLNIASWFTG